MVVTRADAAERFYETEGYEERQSNVLRMVGYFSLVGLLRLHSLIGDYHGALKALGPIHPFQTKSLYTPKIAGEAIPALFQLQGTLQVFGADMSPYTCTCLGEGIIALLCRCRA